MHADTLIFESVRKNPASMHRRDFHLDLRPVAESRKVDENRLRPAEIKAVYNV
jgi:hypothetical protein